MKNFKNPGVLLSAGFLALMGVTALKVTFDAQASTPALTPESYNGNLGRVPDAIDKLISHGLKYYPDTRQNPGNELITALATAKLQSPNPLRLEQIDNFPHASAFDIGSANLSSTFITSCDEQGPANEKMVSFYPGQTNIVFVYDQDNETPGAVTVNDQDVSFISEPGFKGLIMVAKVMPTDQKSMDDFATHRSTLGVQQLADLRAVRPHMYDTLVLHPDQDPKNGYMQIETGMPELLRHVDSMSQLDGGKKPYMVLTDRKLIHGPNGEDYLIARAFSTNDPFTIISATLRDAHAGWHWLYNKDKSTPYIKIAETIGAGRNSSQTSSVAIKTPQKFPFPPGESKATPSVHVPSARDVSPTSLNHIKSEHSR